MKHYLITGGAGFIGSNFIQFLLKNLPDTQITNLDSLTYAGNLENLANLHGNPLYSFEHLNICDKESLTRLFENITFDGVFHFAAESHVDRSIKNPMTFIQTNVVGTANLLGVCLNSWQHMNIEKRNAFRFFHVSTDEVYGSLEPGDKPFSESTPYSPNSPYAASKAASDFLARSYFHTYDLPVIVTNCSNNFGPFQFPEKLIPLVILNAIEGKPLPVYGDGGQIRDWLYVIDHCRALLEVLKNGKPGQTYNIGGNNQYTNLEVVKNICSILDGLQPESRFNPHSNLINFVKDRPGHDRRYAMDINKINKEIGWQPLTTFDQGLQNTVEWYISNQKWVRSVQDKPGYHDWIMSNYQKREGSSS
jgi:dTDP-glucose 4,6-dehydratase